MTKLFKESRVFILVSAMLLAGLLVVRWSVPEPVKEERRIQKRIADGRLPNPEMYVPVWLYKGLKLNLILVGGTLVLSPWLGRRRSAEARLMETPKRAVWGRWQVAGCVLLMGVSAWHHAPRLHHSMWGDEDFNASRFILDQVTRDEAGKIVIEPRPWSTTLWNMRKPTNHLGYSALARLSHDTFFTKGSGPNDPWFSEALLRAPIFIAGLLMIPLFIWSLRVWGLSPWWAILFLMLHPWYLRFGVDGRGYGFIMMAAIGLTGVLGRALQTAYWRWWVLLGLGCFFLLWSNLQGLYVALAFHLAIALALVGGSFNAAGRWLQFRRWLVSGLVTTVLVVGYMAPCLPQILEFLDKKEIQGVMDKSFWHNAYASWFYGQPWHSWDTGANPLHFSIQQLRAEGVEWLALTAVVAFTGVVLIGVVQLLRQKGARLLLVLVLGGPALMALHMQISGNRPYDWYFSPFVPGLFIPAAAGVMWLLRARLRGVPIAVLILLLGGYGYLTQRPRQMLRAHPIEPGRESVALYRKVTNPRSSLIDQEVISASPAMFTESYDPTFYRPKTIDEIRALMAESVRLRKPLYFNMGHITLLRFSPNTKEVCALLDDPAQFEHVATLWGLLPSSTREVYRYRGTFP